jgi:hypothetical protein
MFEEQRLRGEGAGAARAEAFRAGDKQVNGEDQKFAYEANISPAAIECETTRHRRIPSYYEFSTHTISGGPQPLSGNY